MVATQVHNADLQQLLDWLTRAVTPYHAVEIVAAQLTAKGFIQLQESEPWHLVPGQKYWLARRDASLLAFQYGRSNLMAHGLRLLGAHTDSPTLKVKPVPEKVSQGYFQLGIDVYGGVLLAPWFDRDLSLAGRVAVTINGTIQHLLMDFRRPLAIIPSLAIHLDRTANDNRSINPHDHMRPILLQNPSEGYTFKRLLSEELKRQGLADVTPDHILDFDMSFYDTQPAALVGLNQEFLTSARLDNLLSCFVSLQAFLNSDGEQSSVLALFDHEEVGSQSDIGARSNLLNGFLERLFTNAEHKLMAQHNSVFLSIDNAHGVHPNFAHKHDDNHGPKLNAGPVIKYDVNQGYATSTETSALIKHLAQQLMLPTQSFAVRADMRCGSTIGPMTSAASGIRTMDIGLPTFAMHSIRETAGTQDLDSLRRLLEGFINSPKL